MKKINTFAMLLFALALGTAFSQGESKVGVNVSAAGQLPIGGFADSGPGLGIGGLGGIEVGMYPGLAVTARSGYIYHFEKDEVTYFHQIPIMGGAKITGPASLYLAGELGAVLIRSHSDASGLTPSHNSSDTYFGWGAGLGSLVGPTDVRLSFNVLNADNMTNSMTLGLTLGFTVFNM